MAILPALGTVPPSNPVDEVGNVDIAVQHTESSDDNAPSIMALGPGAWLPSAPELSQLPTEPTIEHIRMHLSVGDSHRALLVAERFTEQHKWGRDRDAAWLTIGLIHREAGRHNMASEAFTKVRASKGPLAQWGAWYEAEQDSTRGRHWVAIHECDQYAETYPTGHHIQACAALIARSHAELGRVGAAKSAAQEYDEEHEHAKIGEQIELALARYEAVHQPEAAVLRLQNLARSHSAALTGRVAEEMLLELRDQGFESAVVPDDTESLKVRAISLRTAKRRDDAWAIFEEIARRSEDDPKLAKWVDAQSEVFGWRTRHWDELAAWYEVKYEAKADSGIAWDHYRVLERGGHYDKAMAAATAGLKKHGASRDWRRKEESIARTFLIGGDYETARDHFDTVSARGGWTARRTRFFAAFASFMHGDTEDAITRFDALIKSNRSYLAESRYWRSRALTQLDRVEEAEADLAWIQAEVPQGWYAMLAQQNGADRPTAQPFRRDGTWPGAPLPSLPKSGPADAVAAISPVTTISAPTMATLRPGASGFGELAWPIGGYTTPLSRPKIAPAMLIDNEIDPPASYMTSQWFDPDDARSTFYQFAEKNKETWTDLPAIWDMARVGLYDLSGPLMAEMFEDWRDARKRSGHPRYAQARKLNLNNEGWRELFLFARDHHHGARFTYDLWENVDDNALADDAWRLAYPTAHDHLVWNAARDSGVDPYLVLGLMRQESTYNAIARSRVGASGAMQIMPRTGHLLANLSHDTQFTAQDLQAPTIAVGMGIRYLGLLLDRFDGVYPLAIASYNGGPFNVAGWLQGTGSDMPMDVWVEHIPFRETGDYVKKVSGGYATYLSLYAPDGTEIVLPESPRGDHPEVVDF
ncbi:MAG: transglycosylase SLT domain-containing protein [Rhodobacterales bacterium]|nr:transglycosylase SLT domain-containing protein [Rhodobacterales bacterium]